VQIFCTRIDAISGFFNELMRFNNISKDKLKKTESIDCLSLRVAFHSRRFILLLEQVA